jgi:2'-5' RNA ligase
MRLFAAIDPPAEVIAALAQTVPADDRLRWVPPEQWHITLAFYGEVADATVPELEERLRRAAARTRPLRLSLAGAGTFPSGTRPARVLWCGIEGDRPGLIRLAERVSAAGRRSGIPVEERPLRPHLTLARVRGQPVDLHSVVEELSSFASPEWTAGSLHLVRSHLGRPVVHERRGTWQLGQSHAGADTPSEEAQETGTEA